jgi:hypothetical protein
MLFMVMLILGVTVSNQTSGAGIRVQGRKGRFGIKGLSLQEFGFVRK